MVNAVRMNGDIIAYAALAALAILLLVSIYTDIRYRLIHNKLNLAIAAMAPVYWYASEPLTVSSIGLHLLTAACTFLLFSIFFALRAMGGGDVKLFAALALWFPWVDVVRMIFLATLLGAAVTILFLIIHKLRQGVGPARIPYGVAISIAGLWAAGERFFNHFT